MNEDIQIVSNSLDGCFIGLVSVDNKYFDKVNFMGNHNKINSLTNTYLQVNFHCDIFYIKGLYIPNKYNFNDYNNLIIKLDNNIIINYSITYLSEKSIHKSNNKYKILLFSEDFIIQLPFNSYRQNKNDLKIILTSKIINKYEYNLIIFEKWLPSIRKLDEDTKKYNDYKTIQQTLSILEDILSCETNKITRLPNNYTNIIIEGISIPINATWDDYFKLEILFGILIISEFPIKLLTKICSHIKNDKYKTLIFPPRLIYPNNSNNEFNLYRIPYRVGINIISNKDKHVLPYFIHVKQEPNIDLIYKGYTTNKINQIYLEDFCNQANIISCIGGFGRGIFIETDQPINNIKILFNNRLFLDFDETLINLYLFINDIKDNIIKQKINNKFNLPYGVINVLNSYIGSQNKFYYIPFENKRMWNDSVNINSYICMTCIDFIKIQFDKKLTGKLYWLGMNDLYIKNNDLNVKLRYMF